MALRTLRKSQPGARKKSEPADLREPARGKQSGGKPPRSKPRFRLLPYQRRWVEDDSPLKIVVKARQIGYSFAATLRAVLECLEHKTTWIFLSKGERQSRLLMEKVREHIQACGVVAQSLESTFFEGTSLKQLEARFPNGSVIYGLPANPDTARGYSGNVTLDEFAFHADADKLYAALFPTITRGYQLEIISTPNGQQGKFYELAKAAGLVDGISNLKSEIPNSARPGETAWSAHRCDIYEAARQGLQIDIQLLRSGSDDETTWQQEFCCEFVSTAEYFFSPQLLAACLSAEASTDTPSHLLASAFGARLVAAGVGSTTSGGENTAATASEFFLGIDVGRQHDRTVFWLDEHLECGGESEISNLRSETASEDRVAIARLVRVMDRAPFAEQLEYGRELLRLTTADGRPLVRRAAIDSTGMGAMLAETLVAEFGPRLEPVVFTSAVKEDLAFRTRRRMEAGLVLLPDHRDIRRAFSAVKKLVTPSGNLRFDAARTEAGHSDEFWAKALAELAAEQKPGASWREGFLADARPLINPRAFALGEGQWPEAM